MWVTKYYDNMHLKDLHGNMYSNIWATFLCFKFINALFIICWIQSQYQPIYIS